MHSVIDPFISTCVSVVAESGIDLREESLVHTKLMSDKKADYNAALPDSSPRVFFKKTLLNLRDLAKVFIELILEKQGRSKYKSLDLNVCTNNSFERE